jgi:histidinol dehydrogenase
MRIWNLEEEYEELIASVVGGREKKKKAVGASVAAIKEELLARGEEALVGFSQKWDRWKHPYPLKLSEEEIAEGTAEVGKNDLSVLKGMIGNVRSYHKSQGGRKRTYRRKGVEVREEFIPLGKAMVYVPGGTASYPSSLIMGTVPAQIAGVKEIFVATPAAGGVVNPYTCAAATLLGIKDIYRIGGAQAVYAFAYGIGMVPKADIIVGPGNAFVEEAKRDVYGRVGIDMLAGPTELAILCTVEFSPTALAWDMCSQAEHDEMATVGLFSPSKEHLKGVENALAEILPLNRRREVVGKALDQNGYLVFYRHIDRAIEAINTIAPEHMELIGDKEEEKKVLYPGIIYVGPHTMVSMGDYYIGTNHVLPTGGAGRFTGGLSVDRFTRRKVTVETDRSFLDKYGDSAVRLSEIEGLFAHGEAIKARKEL